MGPMFFGSALPFDALMQKIAALEERINALPE